MMEPATRRAPANPRQTRQLGRQAAALMLGVVALSLASRISVPMVPVPVTLQTLAVMLVGALCGWRLGAVTVLVWLALAAAGLPVLSGATAGPTVFAGPTAGYLLSFPLVAALVGWLAARGQDGRCPRRAFTGMLLAQALCLVIGGAWLALLIGPGRAITAGIVPFIPGAVVKAALGAILLAGWRAFRERRVA